MGDSVYPLVGRTIPIALSNLLTLKLPSCTPAALISPISRVRPSYPLRVRNNVGTVRLISTLLSATLLLLILVTDDQYLSTAKS